MLSSIAQFASSYRGEFNYEVTIQGRTRRYRIRVDAEDDGNYNPGVYEHEIEQWVSDGALSRIDLAFSRNQKEKIYVQHRMLEAAADIWSWLDDGAHFYVCGDASCMAKDVDRALKQIIADDGQMQDEDAIHYVSNMKQDGRYQQDVY